MPKNKSTCELKELNFLSAHTGQMNMGKILLNLYVFKSLVLENHNLPFGLVHTLLQLYWKDGTTVYILHSDNVQKSVCFLPLKFHFKKLTGPSGYYTRRCFPISFLFCVYCSLSGSFILLLCTYCISWNNEPCTTERYTCFGEEDSGFVFQFIFPDIVNIKKTWIYFLPANKKSCHCCISSHP